MTPRKARREVEFMEWDGSKESANQILSWLSENGREAFYVHETDLNPEHLNVPNKWGNNNAYNGDIIVRYPSGGFGTFRAEMFHLQYQEVASAHMADVVVKAFDQMSDEQVGELARGSFDDVSHPADDGEVEPLLEWFDFDHLPMGIMRSISSMFSGLAYRVVREIPQSEERSVVLRRLLEAKDAAVRSVVLR